MAYLWRYGVSCHGLEARKKKKFAVSTHNGATIANHFTANWSIMNYNNLKASQDRSKSYSGTVFTEWAILGSIGYEGN